MKMGRGVPFFFIVVVVSTLIFISCSGAGESKVTQSLTVQSLNPVQTQTTPGGTVVIESKVVNPGNASLTYKWSATGGGFGSSGANNIWQAPPQSGVYQITLTVEDGKGGTAQGNTSITVSSNRAPAITDLSSSQMNVTPGGSTVITCTASDPDGDIVRYSWNASGGYISGTGNKVSWMAPNNTGDFGITCVVSDGKGGESKQTITVSVTEAGSTVTINLVKQESGTVSASGDKDTTQYRAGDDNNNVGYNAFFSYDIFSLNNTKVRLATVKFGPGQITGDPFGALGGLRISQVSYGNGLPDFNTIGDNLYSSKGLFSSAPAEIDVTQEINQKIAAGPSRFQLEAAFKKPSSGNSAMDYIEWPDAVLYVTFAPYTQ
ncbi:MAG: hypothetical protein WB588_00530 [Dehalococcoidia bacterium]